MPFGSAYAKEIEDQKKAEEEKAMIYKDVLSALTEISKTDSSLAYADPNGMISKFLSVIKKIDS
jgi:chaperonin GroEL (HSP60 family)